MAEPTTERIWSPTPTHQCWAFIIGSALFVLGSVPKLGETLGVDAINICYFVGAWFFTTGGFIQLHLSGPRSTDGPDGRPTLRVDWLTAATQFVGTLAFNVSTTFALTADTVTEIQRRVWTPDAGGSVLFLASGVCAVVGYRGPHRLWAPRVREWWSIMINLAGCIAFGVSAVAAFVTPYGVTVDAVLATSATLVGALCFLVASAIMLGPSRSEVPTTG
ncbi:hypothetical protein [Gordonia sp. NPDC003422]